MNYIIECVYVCFYQILIYQGHIHCWICIISLNKFELFFSFSFSFVVRFFSSYIHASRNIGIFVVCMINNGEVHVKNNKHQTVWRTSRRIISIYSLSLLLFRRLNTDKKENEQLLFYVSWSWPIPRLFIVCYCILLTVLILDSGFLSLSLSDILHIVWTTPIRIFSIHDYYEKSSH